MTHDEAKKIAEALLFVSERPVPLDKIAEAMEGYDKAQLKAIIDELNNEYAKTNRCFSVNEVGGGFQILTDPFYAPWIRKLLLKDRKQKLSHPALETLSIIAYRQPITKVDIESIRGVNIDGVLETLLDRALIRITGRKDVVGKPYLYGTTKDFLIHFGLNSLDDLPKLREFSEDDIELGKEELIKRENIDDEPVASEEAGGHAEVRGEEGIKDTNEVAKKD